MRLAAEIFRWTARILSVLVLLFILMFVVGERFLTDPGSLPAGSEWLGIVFFPVGLLIGLFLAWRWERTGGWIALGSFVAFNIWNVFTSGGFPRGIWIIIMTIPAAFYLLAAYLDRPERRDESKLAVQG